MAEAVHKTGNGVLVDKYAQKTALRLGVTPDAVRAEFQKLSRVRTSTSEAGEGPPEETAAPARPKATEVLAAEAIARSRRPRRVGC